ncbi:MAG: biotin--[Alphaproteobacteria bacterium]|nr:biotin--[acetyl-CoA-carboxylase] ligase [Alphaproteobacteria bacterium]
MNINQLKITKFDTITSTQDYAIDIINHNNSISEDILITAKVQTNGRGRLRQRTWISEEGNFHGSYIINIEKLGISINEISIINIKILISLMKFLRDNVTYNNLIQTKLPNDIYYNDKKLAGVLTEIIYPYAIIGIGINVNTSPLDTSISIKEIINTCHVDCINYTMLYKIIIDNLTNINN